MKKLLFILLFLFVSSTTVLAQETSSPKYPDLIVESFSVENGYLELSIKNQGTAEAKPSESHFEASIEWLDANGSSIRTAFNSVSWTTLRRARSLEMNDTSIKPPQNAVKARIIVDPYDRVVESNENNNISSFEITVASEPSPTPSQAPASKRPIPTFSPMPTRSMELFPDLVVNSFSINNSTLEINVKNQGKLETRATAYIRLEATIEWIKDDGTLIDYDIVYYNNALLRSRQPIKMSEDRVQQPVGAIKARITVDPYNLIDEANENNNVSNFEVTGQAETPSPTPNPQVTDKEKIITELTYPITELGSCKNREDCKKYCDNPQNLLVCNEFSVKQGLMTREEAERIRNATQVKSGPGGCSSQDACTAFCEIPANIPMCLDYAQKNNLMSTDELEKARKVANVISSGGNTPGGCSTPESCKNYCSDNSHMQECLSFAASAGIISAEEAAEANKMGDILKNGGPGGCKTRETCQAYCEDRSHGDECSTFFKNAGINDDHEGPNPSGQPEGNGGPACTTLEECKKFCADPANAEACKNVVIKDDQNTSGPSIQGDIGKLRENIQQMPEESQSCIKQAIGADNYNKIMTGQNPTSAINGDAMQSCFEQGVKEYEQKMEPTKKPDDLDMRSSSSGNFQLTPTQAPQVEGISTGSSLFDIIFGWLNR